MAPKRKSSEEIWHLHKRFKAIEAPAGAKVYDNLPGTPPPMEPQSSIAQITREAIEDFKKSAAFEDILATSSSQYFAEGFYACRNWIGHMIPQLDLSHQCINTILACHLPLPPSYFEQAECALQNKLWEDAQYTTNRGVAKAHNEEAEEEEVVVVVEDLEVMEAVEEVRGRGRRVRPRW